MHKCRTIAIALTTLAATGCTSSLTGPELTPDKLRQDGGAYLGAGFNTQPPPPADSTQRGGYLGAGF